MVITIDLNTMAAISVVAMCALLAVIAWRHKD